MNNPIAKDTAEDALLEECLENVEYSNVIGLLMIMREIQQQEPLDDPDILMIGADGTAYY